MKRDKAGTGLALRVCGSKCLIMVERDESTTPVDFADITDEPHAGWTTGTCYVHFLGFVTQRLDSNVPCPVRSIIVNNVRDSPTPFHI